MGARNQIERAMEREEADLEERLARGEITSAEFNRQLRELHRAAADDEREERERMHEQLDRDMGFDRW